MQVKELNVTMLAEHIKTKTTYFANPQDYSFFFTERLKSCVQQLNSALPQAYISIYPDATLKTNLLPTGILCSTSPQNTLLVPTILRDPGCGYLMFKLTANQSLSHDWNRPMAELLDQRNSSSVFNQIKQSVLSNVDFDEIASHGLLTPGLNLSDIDLNQCSHPYFTNTQSIKFSPQEKQALAQDFMQLTNTIEIRKLTRIKDAQILNSYGVSEGDYIGFIHSGSDYFPNLLNQRFLDAICDDSFYQKRFNIKDIEKGIVGVPLDSPLGQEYLAWINAAMNYALVSRHFLFQAVKYLLEAQLPCHISFINDNMHAGLFTTHHGQSITYHLSRGVQPIVSNRLCLLAGQRETMAALVVGGEKADYYGNFFPHGTGYYIREDFDYQQEFTKMEQAHLLQQAQAAAYNSTPDFAACLPYTFNLMRSVEFFEQLQLASSVAYLSPFVNIQSERLKNY